MKHLIKYLLFVTFFVAFFSVVFVADSEATEPRRVLLRGTVTGKDTNSLTFRIGPASGGMSYSVLLSSTQPVVTTYFKGCGRETSSLGDILTNNIVKVKGILIDSVINPTAKVINLSMGTCVRTLMGKVKSSPAPAAGSFALSIGHNTYTVQYPSSLSCELFTKGLSSHTPTPMVCSNIVANDKLRVTGSVDLGTNVMTAIRIQKIVRPASP